jgi:hypothetical protein
MRGGNDGEGDMGNMGNTGDMGNPTGMDTQNNVYKESYTTSNNSMM